MSHERPAGRRLPGSAAVTLAVVCAVLAILVGTPAAPAASDGAQGSAAPVTPAGSSDAAVAYVDVAAATLWTAPDLARPVDADATGNPVDLRRWTDSQTVAERLWLVGKLETQALYGQRVDILGRSGDWVHVAVEGQPTPRNPLGYPGWVPARQLSSAPAYGALYGGTARSRPFALVTTRFATLYTDPARRHASLTVALDTRLPSLGRVGDSIAVLTPDRGVRWLAAGSAHVYRSAAAIPRPTGAELVATATQFEGLPYVWAGTSAWGFDCSGFTHTVYDVHGITIPRDADAQFAAGTPVAFDAMQPGDLIFYAHSNGFVHHVGMYIGNGYEVDAPNNTPGSITRLEIVKVAEHRYASEYAGSRRFL